MTKQPFPCLNLSILAAAVMLSATPPLQAQLIYNFDDATFQGWSDLTVGNDTNNGPRYFTASHTAPSGLFLRSGFHAGAGAVEQVVQSSEDNPHFTLRLRSPEFSLAGGGGLTAWLNGGPGSGSLTGTAEGALPASSSSGGFQGLALRNVNTGVFVLSARKTKEGGWEQLVFSQAQLAALDQAARYTLELIDQRDGGWGWVSLDTVSIPGTLAPPNPGLPVIAFSATPEQITGGQSATLSWSVTNAISISIDQGLGPVAATGSQAVSPVATTTYTLTATGTGGTLTRNARVVVPAGMLGGKTFDTLEGDGWLDPIAGLQAQTPSGNFQQIQNLVYPNNFIGTVPGLTNNGSFIVLWEGWFDVSKEGYGNYTFGTESDDGSVLYLDLNDDGDFDDAGELIVNNKGSHLPQTRTGTVNLQRDSLRVAIAFSQGSGEAVMAARFKKGSGLAYSELDPIGGITGHFLPAAPPGGAPVITFSANPTGIESGQTSTLGWTVDNAATVSIDHGIGTVAASGSRVVAPVAATTYTLTATGPGGTRSRTVTVAILPTGAIRYFRFVPVALRDSNSADSVQLAEFQILLGGLRHAGATAGNPGGNSPGGESPAQANDNNLDSKWLDFTKTTPLVLDFGAPIIADGYRWATANDATERDPVSWRVEGSIDNSNWVVLDAQTNYSVPTERRVFLSGFALSGGTTPPHPPFRVIRITLSPTEVTLIWESQTGATYTIEATENPANASSWVPARQDITSQGATTTESVPRTSATMRFFRVKNQP